jgi:UPF0755 protein
LNKQVKASLVGVAVFVVAIAITVAFFSNQFLNSGVSADTTEVLFDVMPGQTMATVSDNLNNAGLVKNHWLFFQYTRFKGANAKLKKGEYALNQSMTPDQIIGVITSGKSVARNFTVVEGSNIFDLASLVEKNGIGTKAEFFKLANDKEFINQVLGEPRESLEGYLFPETYKITKFDTLKDVITQMVRRFQIVWAEFDAEAKAMGWNRNQVITFASIVEKETGHEKDRTIVSSVFHNRLKKKMRLQTDPTVLYGVAMNQGSMPNNITKLDLVTPTRYNTYTNYGLPPTPISNPGRNAIAATLKPATTKYLYFVSRNDGTTAFSESLNQHNNAVNVFQVNPKAREGKSWKDLKKDK